ncbi:DUF5103 domain-containing protein [bacterium]|nr:MAG: DUF5103 domain-containing protein [bacterium]
MRLNQQAIFAFIAGIFSVTYCASTHSSNTSDNYTGYNSGYLGYQHPLQVIPPKDIKSVYLGNSSRTGLPIIQLGRNSSLTLSFDEMTDYPHSFGVRFKRYTKTWEEDGLVSTQISGGQLEDLMGGGTRSESNYPVFFSFSYTFPNNRISFKVSGNWMVEVFDYNSNEVMFSLPFFITEQIGTTEINYETLNEIQYPSRYQHQFFVDYTGGKEIYMPEFNISMLMIQDGRFGETKNLDIKDISKMNEGKVQFHHSRDDLFIANYDHLKLDIRSFDENRKVRFVEEKAGLPPVLLLHDDDPAFNETNTSAFSYLPISSRKSRYGEVQFSFLTDKEISIGSEIYVTGTFAQWALKPENRLTWNNELNRYTADILLKQGEYAYTYELVKNGRVLKQELQNEFGSTRRSYAVFVFYMDNTRFIERLVHVNEFMTK